MKVDETNHTGFSPVTEHLSRRFEARAENHVPTSDNQKPGPPSDRWEIFNIPSDVCPLLVQAYCQ